MLWVYDPGYDYGSGIPGAPQEVHGFILRKPSEIRDRLAAAGVFDRARFGRPEPVSIKDLKRVHDDSLIAGLRDPNAIALAIEFGEIAWLPEEVVWQAVVEPQLLAAGGTYRCLRAASHGEWAINLSGGYHHARRNLSHGFCLINDLAVAVARLRHEGIHRSILIVDLDLHQGDGNAMVFASDRDIYTASVHEEDLFPIPKARSDLDIGLPSFVGDDEYLTAVKEALRHARRAFQPDIIVFVAGSDPYAGDPLGTLQVSAAGMLERDRLVGRFARDLGRPLVVLPAGGYSNQSPSIAAAGMEALAAMESGGRG